MTPPLSISLTLVASTRRRPHAGALHNAAMRRLVGLDTLQASQLLRRLRDQGLLELHAAGSASYYTLGESLTDEDGRPPQDRLPLEEVLQRADQDTSAGQPDTSRQEKLFQDLPTELRQSVESLGSRAPLADVQAVIGDLCAWRAFRPGELAKLLDRSRKHVLSAYIKPLVDAGELERTHPETPHHPDQAYVAVNEKSGGEK